MEALLHTMAQQQPSAGCMLTQLLQAKTALQAKGFDRGRPQSRRHRQRPRQPSCQP